MPQIYLEIDASGAVRGIRQYSRAASDGADATDRLAGTANNAGGGLAGMVGKAAGAAAAVVSIAAAVDQVSKSLQTFAQFDDQLRVAASYAGATAEEFRAMGRAAAEAGATTSKTASQAAQGLAEFASRGFSVREQIEALVPAIRLAEAAQVDLGRATEVSSGILRGYGKDVSELERINDIIVGISGASAANLNFVGDAAKYAIPAARAVGEEFETVAAILGTLADQQFEAGQSGNALKNFLVSLTGPTSKAQKALDKLGVSTRDAQGNFLGLVPIFKQLNAANLDLTDSTAIFGRYFTTAALAVTKSIGEVESDLDLLKYGIDGITESTAEFQQAGLGGSFRRLESAVEAVYIAVGDQLAPIISDVARVLAEFAGNASKAAGATSGIITGVRVLAQVMLGAYNAVDILVDSVTGLFSFAVNNSPLYRGLELVTEGLKKIGAIDVNPFESARKGITEFADAQDGSFKRVQDRVNGLNAQFDKYQRNVEKNLKSAQAAEAAERALKKAAEDAATAAGKQAIAAGKSTEEALSAAEAARKAYLTSAQAAKEQEAADKKAAEAAAKRRAALEKQAETVKQQALSYGATESAAQAAADKVLEAGQAADNISGAGPDKLNKSLDQTAQKAGAAKTALSGIGEAGIPAGAGGEISYSVGLSTGDYDQKVSELKESIRSLNNDYQVKINFDPEGAENLKKELEATEKKLQDTQAIQGYNEQLRSLQAQYREVRQEFLGGKLVVTTDPEAAANIRNQIAAVTDLKLSVDGVIPGMERVNGVWQQLPDSVATAVQPAIASLGTFANAAGEIETTWKKIDGVWKEVLPDGTDLVEQMNGSLSAGTEIAYGFADSVAGAAKAAAGDLSPVKKALKEVEDQIVKTQNAAGSLKIDQLATQTGAFNAVSAEISALKKNIKDLDPASAEAAAAIKQLLQLEAVKSEIGSNIKELKDEIYNTGEEAKKTAEKIKEVPKVAESAAKAVEELAEANKKVAMTTKEMADSVNRMGLKAGGKQYTFAAPDTSTIEGMEKYVQALQEMRDGLHSIKAYKVSTPGIDENIEKYTAEIEERKRKDRILSGTEPTGAATGAPPTVINNFYGMDRSDAVDVSKESARQLIRA